PQPDSPTMPSVSPRLTARLTSSTACTTAFVREKTPCRTGKCFVRPSSSTSAPFPIIAPANSLISDRHPQLGRDAFVPDLALALRRQVARVGVAAGDRHERRALAVARREAVLAARVERAALRRPQERRRRALDRHEDVEALLDRRHRLEQPPRV